MTDGQTTPRSAPPPRPGAQLRIAGIVILVAGLVAAGLVYSLSKPEVAPDELATPENSKRAARDVASNYGQMGAFSYALGEDLKDPAIQAAIIAGLSIFLAGGCFYIARLDARDPGPGGPAG